MELDAFRLCLRRLVAGESLSREESEGAFALAFRGGLSDVLLAGFLVALHGRGETPAEIAGAALAMRSVAVSVEAPAGSMDIVGTGGDGKRSLNISTAAAFVVAGCGVSVAKHGNRAVTSASGAADVLEALGIDIEAGDAAAIAKIERAIRDAHIGFLFARSFHPGMRYITPVRQELGVRTVFNLLGPLCNPAGVGRLLLGVYDGGLVRPMAEVLSLLGVDRVWVVHGADGLDELSTTGENIVCSYADGVFDEFVLSPSDLGLAVVDLEALRGGSAAENARRLDLLLRGERDAFRDVVLLNASAALVVAERVGDLQEGLLLAADSIDSGKALEALESLRHIMSV